LAASSLPDAPAIGELTAAQASAPQQTGSISGTVTDPSGALVTDAHVVLTVNAAGGSAERTTTSGSDGHFTFSAVPAGDFRLTISSSGFTSLTTTGVLHPGENYTTPDLTLQMGVNNSDVSVTIPQEELGEYEIKTEEKQRVLGVIPNFYVSYVPHPVPLTPHQKFELAWRALLDPVSIVGTGASAGILMADDDFNGYGQGASGYAKRYGAVFADSTTSDFLGNFLLPVAFKQDPRYYYKGTGSVTSRIFYALAFSVRCKGDNGKWQPAYSGILGGLASGAISNLYYPAADRNGAALTFENAGLGILGGAVGNLFQEFLVKHLTPKVPKYADAP
jgi:hypothetical protein